MVCKLKRTVLIGALVVFFSIMPIFALELESVGVLGGFLSADIVDKDDYKVIPLMVSFDFDAKPIFENIGFFCNGSINFTIEPFINTVISPDTNVEIGSNFLIRYIFPLSEHLKPYIKGGLGVLYMSQHTREQSTQYNFLPQVGGGIMFFINENVAITTEYRYRHLSNASFDYPNKGINANLFLSGITLFF